MWYNGHMILAMRQVSAAAPPVRQRAARCAIDGFAKMPLRASIFASWYIAWDFAYKAKSSGFAASALSRGCAIDGLAKMPLHASIFASWYNCLRRMLLCSLRGLCPQPCLRHGLGIDGLAKMPLQASIFASWYNLLGILPMAKSKRLCRARAFARLRN